jgi:hypothetical protein
LFFLERKKRWKREERQIAKEDFQKKAKEKKL